MSEIFKTFKGGEKKITPTVTHKDWEVTSENSASLGVEYLFGFAYDHKAAKTGSYQFNISDSHFGGAVSLPITNNGSGRVYYHHLMHKSIDHLYYGLNDNPYNSFCNDAPHKMVKELDGIVNVISIPSSIYGEKIKPGSLTLSKSDGGSNNWELTDDGHGNLRDLNDHSSSVAATTLSSSLLYAPFTDYWRHTGEWATFTGNDGTFVATSSTFIEAAGDYEACAYNVNYVGMAATIGKDSRGEIIFHGSHSLQESNSIDNPSDNSFIQIKGTKDLDLESDFAISLWVKCPESQSVSESYSGPWDYENGTNSRITRTLRTGRQRNTILTTREWWGNNCPISLEIINSLSADKGKFRVTYKSKTEGWINDLTSTNTFNDGEWHHVLITVGGGTCYLIVDGTTEDSGDYIPSHLNTRWPVDMHLGARPYNYKQRYRNTEHQKWFNQKDQKNYIDPFSGSIACLRLYDEFINPSNTHLINCVSSSFTQDNYVGNIFYEHGIVTGNIPQGSDGQLYTSNWGANSTTLRFKGTHKIKEHLYICNILDGEFNATYNPTAREKFDERNDNLQAYTTHSEFNPYITTIGLYNDSHELVAVGKLAQPIKNQDDYDNTFQIRFDTTI